LGLCEVLLWRDIYARETREEVGRGCWLCCSVVVVPILMEWRRKIGERTFAHSPGLYLPCHGPAIATEDIIFDRSVYSARWGAKDIEHTCNFGIHPLCIDEKAC